jgi:hypothetical protein
LRFTYYTDKTVSQCMMALNERLHGTGRSGLEGWVEKGGNFSLSVSSTVAGRFNRTTRLQAKAERESGITTIKGYVSDGVAPRERVIIYGALILVGLLLMTAGALLPAVIAIGAAPLLHIPLTGDYKNSRVLLSEVHRTLKAKDTPPLAAKKSAPPRKSATR